MSAKRLRARKPPRPGARTASGRRSRAKTAQTAEENEIRAVAVAARQRIHGLKRADAVRAEAGTVVGRLYLITKNGGDGLSFDQAEAAHWLLECRNRFAWAVNAPDAVFQAPTGAAAIIEEEDKTRIANSAIRVWNMIEGVLVQAAMVYGRKDLKDIVLDAVLRNTLAEADQEPLRFGLQALAEYRR